MNLIDRAIEYVAPGWAADRARARLQLAYSTRAFDAARMNRAFGDWWPAATESNADIRCSLRTLRARARDLSVNNPHGANAVGRWTADMIGTGIIPRAATGDPELNKRIDDAFAEWNERADADGVHDFYGLQALAARSMFESGDMLALRIRRNMGRAAPPLAFRLLEGDHLDVDHNQATSGRPLIRMGVEFAADGRRAAYHVFDEHPGQTDRLRPDLRRRHPASAVVHLFRATRPGQVRGVPWLVAAILKARQLDDYHMAELERKKLEAAIVAIVFGVNADGDTPLAPVVQDKDGNPIEKVSAGSIAYANGAGSVEFNRPASSGGFAEFNRAQLQGLAAAALMPYEVLAADLSQTNYSSARVGLTGYRTVLQQVQQLTFVPQFCRPVWRAFISDGVGAGLWSDRPDIGRVEWTCPRFASVDPLKEAQADLINARLGKETVSEQIRRDGGDPDQVFDDHAREKADWDEKGLVFDADPRRVSRTGGAQGQAAELPPPDPEGVINSDD